MKKPDIKHFTLFFLKHFFKAQWIQGFFFFFPSILRGRWCSSSDHTQEDLAKFGYMSERRGE
jgi:hypothetical protein